MFECAQAISGEGNDRPHAQQDEGASAQRRLSPLWRAADVKYEVLGGVKRGVEGREGRLVGGGGGG